MSAGRKALGPALVEHLQGSGGAKERLEVILQTIAGQATIAQASQRLGIGEAMFHRLRKRVLEAGLQQLEPRPMGRPSRSPSPEEQRIAQLQRQLDELQDELQIAEVREEIALVMPHLIQKGQQGKKTTANNHRHRRPKSPLLKKRRRKRPT